MARQPIFDRRLHVWAYELLFRDMSDARESPPTAETATARVIVDALMEIGLDRVVGNALALVNVPRLFLVGDLPLVLPPKRIAIELLEDVAIDPPVIAALGSIVDEGYTLVLDDFTFDESMRPALQLAQVVKIEVDGRSRAELEETLQELEPYAPKLLAEKVETHEAFELCRDLGFDYFQGFFFATPKPVPGRATHAGLLSKLRLAIALQKPTVEFEELEQIVAQDIALSYRLLRYINSAFFGLPRTVHSLRDALVLLGEDAFRRWATVMLLAGVEGKPEELLSLALIRARMSELLGESVGIDRETGTFVTGLFSVLDALADVPLTTILDELPLADEITDALLRFGGVQGDVLRRVLAYERGAFEEAVAAPFDVAMVSDAYVDAVAWASAAADAIV